MFAREKLQQALLDALCKPGGRSKSGSVFCADIGAVFQTSMLVNSPVRDHFMGWLRQQNETLPRVCQPSMRRGA